MKQVVNGQEVEVKQLSFQAVTEPWSEYLAEDGSTIRIKMVLMKLFRTETKHPDGSTVYVFQSQQVMAVDEPEKSSGSQGVN